MAPALSRLIFCCLLSPLLAFGAEVGMVAAFNLSSCPDKWSAVSDMQGRLIVGVGTLGSQSYSLGATGGAAFHSLSVSEMPSHDHGMTNFIIGTGSGGGGYGLAAGWGPFSNWGFSGSTDTRGAGSAFDNRQPYLALLYCVRTSEEETTMGFWPEMSMSDAMQIGSAVLVCFAFAWGIGQIVRSLFNR